MKGALKKIMFPFGSRQVTTYKICRHKIKVLERNDESPSNDRGTMQIEVFSEI